MGKKPQNAEKQKRLFQKLRNFSARSKVEGRSLHLNDEINGNSSSNQSSNNSRENNIAVEIIPYTVSTTHINQEENSLPQTANSLGQEKCKMINKGSDVASIIPIETDNLRWQEDKCEQTVKTRMAEPLLHNELSNDTDEILPCFSARLMNSQYELCDNSKQTTPQALGKEEQQLRQNTRTHQNSTPQKQTLSKEIKPIIESTNNKSTEDMNTTISQDRVRVLLSQSMTSSKENLLPDEKLSTLHTSNIPEMMSLKSINTVKETKRSKSPIIIMCQANEDQIRTLVKCFEKRI